MNDLVSSLRHTKDTEIWQLCEEAADAIERLTAENDRLRPLLEAALLYEAWASKGDYPHDEEGCIAHDAIREAVRSYQQKESNDR